MRLNRLYQKRRRCQPAWGKPRRRRNQKTGRLCPVRALDRLPHTIPSPHRCETQTAAFPAAAAVAGARGRRRLVARAIRTVGGEEVGTRRRRRGRTCGAGCEPSPLIHQYAPLMLDCCGTRAACRSCYQSIPLNTPCLEASWPVLFCWDNTISIPGNFVAVRHICESA